MRILKKWMFPGAFVQIKNKVGEILQMDTIQCSTTHKYFVNGFQIKLIGETKTRRYIDGVVAECTEDLGYERNIWNSIMAMKDNSTVYARFHFHTAQFYRLKTFRNYKGGFILSGKVASHDVVYCITKPEDLINFYYLATNEPTDEHYLEAQIHYASRDIPQGFPHRFRSAFFVPVVINLKSKSTDGLS